MLLPCSAPDLVESRRDAAARIVAAVPDEDMLARCELAAPERAHEVAAHAVDADHRAADGRRAPGPVQGLAGYDPSAHAARPDLKGAHMPTIPGLEKAEAAVANAAARVDPMRYLRATEHLTGAFGTSGFGARAEAFARFFGTPKFLIAQTIVVAVWIALNSIGMFHFDIYPFILLNLAFSLQAAYAAPLILLAQTRQADRDKAMAEADAQHREELAQESLEREGEACRQNEALQSLLEQNTRLTVEVNALVGKINALTQDIHDRVAGPPGPAPSGAGFAGA